MSILASRRVDFAALAAHLAEHGLKPHELYGEDAKHGRVDDHSPDGLYRLRGVFHNSYGFGPEDRAVWPPPIPDATFEDPVAFRDQLKALAAGPRATPRQVATPWKTGGVDHYLLVWPDGSTQTVGRRHEVTPAVVGGEAGPTLSLDLWDRLERSCHRVRTDEAFRQHIRGSEALLEGDRYVPSDPALWKRARTPSLRAAWPKKRELVLNFAARELPEEAREAVAEVGEGLTQAVGVTRWTESRVTRSLYLGDFSYGAGDAPPAAEVVIYQFQREWAP